MATTTYTSNGGKLGRHHLAHLRAVAEGVDLLVSASRYLAEADAGTAMGRVAARHAHQAVVDRVRAVARRTGDPRWRLIGLQIQSVVGAARPSLDQWAEERGLEGFSQAEQLELYLEAFPPDRRSARNNRLRAKQLALIERLAETAAEPARPTDRIDAWLSESLATRLQAAGLLLLADLIGRVQAGGRWWLRSPRINALGRAKAERIAQHLEVLIPGCTGRPAPSAVSQRGLAISASLLQDEVAAGPVMGSPSATGALPMRVADRAEQLASGVLFALSSEQLASRDLTADAAGVRAWIHARAKTPGTAKVYRRELARFLLFLAERGRTFSTCLVDDCQAYRTHLAYLPPSWIARSNVPFGQPGWSPFARQLSAKGQAQAQIVISACFAWLLQAGYLSRNPWKLVARAEIDPAASKMGSRAIRPRAWDAIVHYLADAAPADPSAARVLFVARFLEATGLRASELLQATLADLERDPDGDLWLRNVRGKGGRRRDVMLAGQAEAALVDYLASRGLGLDSKRLTQDGVDLSYALVGGLQDPLEPIAYRTLHETVRMWLGRAIRASHLRPDEQRLALQASPHWLRHTFGTRALERGVDIHVVSKLMGHSDTRMTQHYSRAQEQLISRQLKVAFPGPVA